MNYNIHVLFIAGKKECESDLSNKNSERKTYFHTNFCLHFLTLIYRYTIRFHYRGKR